jgi:hypothetical protein
MIITPLLSKKRKKKNHPIKERKQMQNPCFFHMAMKKGRRSGVD